jgi:hypothetical protein
MRSRWIEHNGKRILYQDFANLFYNWEVVRDELLAVQEVVLAEPYNSVLALSDFTNTEISGNLLPIMNASSKATKSHVRRTAVVGISGIKRTFGDLLSRITGQQLMYFTNDVQAKDWLVRDQ